MQSKFQLQAEWLEADGLGGFASGTVSGIRSRRYHGLLLTAITPPTGRVMLVNGFDAWVETDSANYSLSSQCYSPDIVSPDGVNRIEAFEPDPWPRWSFLLEDGRRIEQEILVKRGSPLTAISWHLKGQAKGAVLAVRPFLSGRDYHSLHHENPDFRLDADIQEGRVRWRPYANLPEIVAITNGDYTHEPFWYRNFLYEEERTRGLDFAEDLAAPGTFRWDLSQGDAVLILTTQQMLASDAEVLMERIRKEESARRKHFSSRLERAADAYIVSRGAGRTIVAGYPWFTDWGRDTFIALRGLCLATGRVDVARDILLQWAGTVSEGMLPNRFPDQGSTPEFNSVDASLWYIIAIHDYLKSLATKKEKVAASDQKIFREAIQAILTGYKMGTRYRIRMDEDGLLSAGETGVQLTWMDAKVGDWVVTPRIGKPVEVQALWLNALWIASHFSEKWKALFDRGRGAFNKRFWNEEGGYLYDVIDVDHQTGKLDASFRPNQILAVGGLPISLLSKERAQSVVNAVERLLLTPLGLRTLAPGSPGYAPHYEGGVRDRDGAYHQGTVWPWLLGPFVEAWVRVHGETQRAKEEASQRFFKPLLDHLNQAGLGHISEIADAEPPHTPRGCPFQAWSVGEALRLAHFVLAGAKKDAVQPQRAASGEEIKSKIKIKSKTK